MELFQYIVLALLVVVVIEVSYLIFRLPGRLLRGRTSLTLLDTSVLIDGRIVSVAKTGFLPGTLVIPRSVIGELQLLADGSDHDKRERARYGLDVVSELQALPGVTIEILQDGSRADEGVDERLLSLAKKHEAAICTLDYNLNKVALVESIAVLNINELAQSLRMAHLPGEHMQVQLVQKGQDGHQAVGYLADGTMVVVERASQLIGQAIEVEVIRSLQTAAGRMMFARPTAVNNARKNTQKQVTAPTGRQQPKKTPKPRTYRPGKGRSPSKDPESNLIHLVNESAEQ